jgi:hypothetical protein
MPILKPGEKYPDDYDDVTAYESFNRVLQLRAAVQGQPAKVTIFVQGTGHNIIPLTHGWWALNFVDARKGFYVINDGATDVEWQWM